MTRTGIVVGLIGVAGLAGAATYASSRFDGVTGGPTMNAAAPMERVRVEVLNAGGIAGQARSATEQLREIGFDVVYFGNAGTFDRDSSAVVDRVGRPDLARAVAEVLGVGRVTSEPDPNLFVDVTVLLGKEWRGEPEEASAPPPPEREPWDPRGWIGR